MFERLSAGQLWTYVEPILWLPKSEEEEEKFVESILNYCGRHSPKVEIQIYFRFVIVYIYYSPYAATAI